MSYSQCACNKMAATRDVMDGWCNNFSTDNLMYMYMYMRIYTIEKMEAISDECPKGSICQATRGLASAPNVSSTNFNPGIIETCMNILQTNTGQSYWPEVKIMVEHRSFSRAYHQIIRPQVYLATGALWQHHSLHWYTPVLRIWWLINLVVM